MATLTGKLFQVEFKEQYQRAALRQPTSKNYCGDLENSLSSSSLGCEAIRSHCKLPGPLTGVVLAERTAVSLEKKEEFFSFLPLTLALSFKSIWHAVAFSQKKKCW